MTIWTFDTEFDEDGKTIELISIGIVSELGHEYYAASKEFDPLHCNPWVRENVLTKLPPPGDKAWKTRAEIASDIRFLVNKVSLETKLAPVFWAYYADYDWVALCQLFGKMIDLPPGWPMYCKDLKQLMDDFRVSKRDLPEQPEGTEHNALDDARWNLDAIKWMNRFYK